MKKRAFTLIEVVVSFFLLSILLTTFFSSYSKLAKEKRAQKELYAPLVEERHCYLRLKNMLSKALSETPSLFYTSEDKKTLFFTFDHGLDPDSHFSQSVFATLYLDAKSHTLCYTLSPHPKHEESSKEKTFILLHDVTDIDFQFYHPPDLSLQVDVKEVGDKHPLTLWQNEWKKTYETIPTFIEVTLLRNQKKLPFFFAVEERKKPIIYFRRS